MRDRNRAVSCPGINAVTGASRCHASGIVLSAVASNLNRHAPFSWDKRDR